jgi:hypothetical protein
MQQRLKVAIDRKFTSIRDVLDYIDTHLSIVNLDNTSLEQLVRELKPDEKKEVLEKINRIRHRRITSKL